MTVSQLINGRQQFLDPDNVPLVGGHVEFYEPGTLTLKTTWSDSGGIYANDNPIILDAIGSAAIWGTGSYRQIVRDPNGNLLWDVVVSAPANSVGVLYAANNLSDVADAATARANLGLGTAATQNIDTSGANVPLLSTNNNWSGTENFVGHITINGGAEMVPAVLPGGNAVGFLGTPQVLKTTNYVLAMTDVGREIFAAATITVTIPPVASVPWNIGYIIDIAVDQTFTLSLLQGAGVTLRWPVGNATGTRTVTGPGAITIKMEKTNEWWVRGGVNIS